MRLVQGEQADFAALQQIEEARGHQTLGRHIDQVKLATLDLPFDLHRVAPVQRGVEVGGIDADLTQGIDLIAHQRDQRRDDHRDTGPHQRRDLEAQRFAAAGRHQHHRVASGDHMVDDAGLLSPERVIAIDPTQGFQRRVAAFHG